MASISSMKMIQGACFLASSKSFLTLEAPRPANISTKSDPPMEKKGTDASPAMALASSVFPVPGRPSSNTPLGICPPSRLYLEGCFRKSMISFNSSRASEIPATSLKVTPVFVLEALLVVPVRRNRFEELGDPLLNIIQPPSNRTMISMSLKSGVNTGAGWVLIVTSEAWRSGIREVRSGENVVYWVPVRSVAMIEFPLIEVSCSRPASRSARNSL